MINVDYEHSVTLTFSNTKDGDDLNTFVSILAKCNKEAKKAGFKNMFKGREKDMISGLYSVLSGQVNESDHVFSDRATIQNNTDIGY